MSNDIQVFKFDEMGVEISALLINGEPYFVGKQVAESLGYKNTRDAISKHVDEEDKLKLPMKTNGGLQTTTYISKKGVKCLSSNSRLLKSKIFLKSLNIDKFNYKKIYNQVEFENLLRNMLNFQLNIDALQWNFQHSSSSNKLYKDSLYFYTEYKIGDYRVDFYFPEFNIVVEYDEKYHFGKENEDTVREERIKEVLDHHYAINKDDGCLVTFIRVKEGKEIEGIVEIISHLLYSA